MRSNDFENAKREKKLPVQFCHVQELARVCITVADKKRARPWQR